MSDYDQKHGNKIDRRLIDKLLKSDPLVEEEKLDPEKVYDNFRISIKKKPKYQSKSQHDYRMNFLKSRSSK